MTLIEPVIVKVAEGWAAVGEGWAVFAESETAARERYVEAARLHGEIAAREVFGTTSPGDTQQTTRLPATEAGRALLRSVDPLPSEPKNAIRKFIIAIEAEAATLDVDRLARTLQLMRYSAPTTASHHEIATAIAAEYARLTGTDR